MSTMQRRVQQYGPILLALLVLALLAPATLAGDGREEPPRHEDGDLKKIMEGLEHGIHALRALDRHGLLPPGGRRKVDLNDAGVAALELIKRYGDRWKRAVSASAAARDLVGNHPLHCLRRHVRGA